MKNECANCRFFSPRASNGKLAGECRHGPPTVFMVAVPAQAKGSILPAGGQRDAAVKIQFHGAHPPVPGDHWCGKHELAPDLPTGRPIEGNAS
jgi:hypothetical protein